MSDSTRSPSQALAGLLWIVGIAKLILAAITLILAFTGYETTEKVNVQFLLNGINLILLSLLCFGASRALRISTIDQALKQVAMIFGYYAVLLALFIVFYGAVLVAFLTKIITR